VAPAIPPTNLPVANIRLQKSLRTSDVPKNFGTSSPDGRHNTVRSRPTMKFVATKTPSSSTCRRSTACVSGWSVSAPASSIRSAPSYWSAVLPCGKACASCALSCHAFSQRPAMPCRGAWCVSQIDFDHPDQQVGWALVMDALATADGDFLNGIVDRLANASAQGQDIDPRVLNFRSAAVTS